jgi:hypothetical protein
MSAAIHKAVHQGLKVITIGSRDLVHGCISQQSHKDTQDSASLAPFLGASLSLICETSPSNCYLKPVVTREVFQRGNRPQYVLTINSDT